VYYFLTEEESMSTFIEVLLPKLGFEKQCRVLPFNGKSDLKTNIRRKIISSAGDSKFIILIDQDTKDCLELKKELLDIAEKAVPANSKIEYKIRIACQELESWYLGDLSAVDIAFGTKLKKKENKIKFRDPDNCFPSPREDFRKAIGKKVGQIAAAEKMAEAMTLDGINNNKSHSFQVFVETVRRAMQTSAL
jgi:hypothetical protein